MNRFEAELRQGEELSIINLVNFLIAHALHQRASDIHLDPKEDNIRVRLRIDGRLQDEQVLPKNIQAEIISRIKILASLRTDEHKAAQDGRFRFNISGNGDIVDIRVSIAPTYYGENAVLRLLVRGKEEHRLESLGINQADQIKISQAIKKPHGLILVAGPTGSGKTTTLYTLIKLLNSKDVSIITIEDPIEYAIDGVNQIGVNLQSGLTFANGLRSILRQDPDIVMVGEIRDQETARLAVNTALTGHLVLSTIHTNNAPTILVRLLDMGIEPYLIASTVRVVIGQRLVRRVCTHCKFEKQFNQSEVYSLSEILPGVDNNLTFYEGKGCLQCQQTGFWGRVGVFEVMFADQEIREAILNKKSVHQIKQIASSRGMKSLMENGWQKVEQGITTPEEVLKLLHE